MSERLAQKLGAEFLGTAFLLAAVIGSGIMGERLAGAKVALALLCNMFPRGALLVVLITMLAPILAGQAIGGSQRPQTRE